MDRETAEKAIEWTEGFLGFAPKLTPDQRREWVRMAMDTTPEEWSVAVKLHYRTRLKDFPPPPKVIYVLIPGKDKPAEQPKKSLNYPRGWEEDPNKSFAENYRSMIDARFKEKENNI